mgnify:CR=1 FL=1
MITPTFAANGRRVPQPLRHRLAHGGEVNDARHAREVLEQDASRHERDLGLGGLAEALAEAAE